MGTNRVRLLREESHDEHNHTEEGCAPATVDVDRMLKIAPNDTPLGGEAGYLPRKPIG